MTQICYINTARRATCGFSRRPARLHLPPGGSQSIVVAYIFAAPVEAAGCAEQGCHVTPGDPTILGDAVRMA